MSEYNELKESIKFLLKEHFKERSKMEYKATLKKSADRATEIIQKTIDSITLPIEDELLTRLKDIREAASKATLAEEVDRISERLVNIAVAEAEKAGQVFIDVLKEAATEAVKETLEDFKKGNIS